MKKNLFLGIIIFGVVFFVYTVFYKPTMTYGRSIAIFVPAQHPAMDEIVAGFCDSLQERMPFIDFTVYNGQGNKTLMQSQAEIIVGGNHELVFTIGNLASQLIRSALSKRKVRIPHIFTAVDDPVEKGLVDNLNSPGNGATGVISLAHFDEQIDYLLMVKPTVKIILLAYDPTHVSNAVDVKKLERVLQEKGIQLRLCPIGQMSEMGQKIPPMLNNVDALLILKDHLLVMGVELLTGLCAQKGIPLYCSDLNSSDKGAALAFGIREAEYGIAAESLAFQILVEKKDAGSIPVKEIKKLYFKINSAVIKQQGIELTDERLDDFKKQGVIVI